MGQFDGKSAPITGLGDIEKPHIHHDDVAEKKLETGYIADHTGSHHKSKEERTLVMKIDLVIIPLCSLLYLVAYLDRNSIGNARTLGMQKDLNLSTKQWGNCLSLFYIGYMIFMLPGNILLRKLTPHRQLGACAIVFGAFLLGMSGAANYATVLTLRIFIGASQAFIQGLSLYSTLWYKRDEVATRGAIIYMAAIIAGSFSGFIAYGVGKNLRVDNTGRLSWSWLFIIEGAMCMAVGVATWLILPTFPDKLNRKHWLFTPAEIDLAKERSASYNTLGSKINVKQIIITLIEPKAWAFATINAGVALGISSISTFLPTFIQAFGYSRERTQLFSAIPYACAIVAIPLCIISDRINHKGSFLIGTLSVACIGYIILLCNVSQGANIAGACLATTGLYPSIIILSAWITINAGGYTKRATNWAMAEIVGQLLSVLGAYIYDVPPRFLKGHSIVLALLALGIVNCLYLMWWMRRANLRREMELIEYEREGRVHPHTNMSLEEVQDLHVRFRYIL
ncbi:MFS general substrate transporter [Eremomyces bilateralis CBS 781.70]|uniref:MFS general substrate transporter n=1 Tax=Eremomyces bilateralis CBS 781.70 TaxID=1392243 RepID=A0A6G1GHY8_9PEZI|nr:MFS general substrate transporter [Eremomyces bilateralis CBS 781.70]KAF1817566.1 MFS general substrate transporter [Eremomyces bilateralis CBS 781.70]